MNNRFMLELSDRFAKRLEKDYPNNDTRVEAAFQMTLSRAPLKQEREAMTRFIEAHGLPSFSRLMFNLNEFVYIN